MAQLLVNVLPVSIAGGATTALPHLLESNGVGVAPTLVFPDRPTTIAAVGVDATNVTFQNKGVSTATANFRCERGWQPEVDAFTVTPLLYGGAGNAVSGAGYFRAASLLSPQPGLVTGDLPVTATVPAGSYRNGSTVRTRIAGVITIAGVASTFTLSVFGNAAKTADFGTVTTLALVPGSYTICVDFAGSVGGGAASQTFSSAEGTVLTTTLVSSTAISPPGSINAAVANVITPAIVFGTPNAGTSFELRQLVIDVAF